jgi:coproporphyrinogen III oxidase-like Fe-S oxidoreductase
MYDMLLDRTNAHGLIQYEIANFARHRGPAPAPVPDRACRHNINYWRGGAFLGLGPSASGFVNGVRTRNSSNTNSTARDSSTANCPLENEDDTWNHSPGREKLRPSASA